MRLDLNNLPHDVALLHRLGQDLSHQLNEQQSTLTQTRHELKSKTERTEGLEYPLAHLRQTRFSKSSEKLSPDQLALWQSELDEQIAETEQALAQEQDKPVDQFPSETSEKPKRNPLPAHLPREDQVHTLPCCAACNGELKEIGEEVLEQLDYCPASFFVRRHTKKKYACWHPTSSCSLLCRPFRATSLRHHVLVPFITAWIRSRSFKKQRECRPQLC